MQMLCGANVCRCCVGPMYADVVWGKCMQMLYGATVQMLCGATMHVIWDDCMWGH